MSELTFDTNLVGRVVEYSQAGEGEKPENWCRAEVFAVEARQHGLFVWMRHLETNKTVNRPLDAIRVLAQGEAAKSATDPRRPAAYAFWQPKDGQLWLIEAEESRVDPRNDTCPRHIAFYAITRSALDVPYPVEAYVEVSGRMRGSFERTLAVTPVSHVSATFAATYMNVADQRKR